MIQSELYDIVHAGDVTRTAEWLDARPDDLNEPVSDGYTALHVACMFGHEPLVRFLLSRRALVNSNANNASGATPLHLAVAFRDDETAEKIVELLIECGAELNAAQAGGQTALHHAVARGSVRLVRALVLAGADPFLKDSAGNSSGDMVGVTEEGKATADTVRAELKRAFSLPLETR